MQRTYTFYTRNNCCQHKKFINMVPPLLKSKILYERRECIAHTLVNNLSTRHYNLSIIIYNLYNTLQNIFFKIFIVSKLAYQPLVLNDELALFLPDRYA